MIATRYLHRSNARLNVGDELVSPAVLCERDGGASLSPRAYANWPEYCDGQHTHVYFSMMGTRADKHTYVYYGRTYTYVVEPLGPVEPDPEDKLQGGRGPSGSLRCERAKIVEAHVNGFIGPRLEDGSTRRFANAPAFKGWQDNYVKQCARIAEPFNAQIITPNVDALRFLKDQEKA